MAASVLKTYRAVEVSLYVVRALVEPREAITTHKELATPGCQLNSTIYCRKYWPQESVHAWA